MPSREESSAGVTQKFVVYHLEDGGVRTHGGPYPPMKAKEVTEAMQSHVDRNNHRDWNIPEETTAVEAVTREELRELRGFDNAE